MELIYSMRRKHLKCEPPNFDGTTDPEAVRPICTISVCNIIAFTSFTELSDVDGDTWGGHVYVCDIVTPWNSYKVTSTTHPVSALEWDGEGKHLLVATTVGDVYVYGQKDYLLNEWTCLYTGSFPGERVIKAIFFHNGRRVVVSDKKSEISMAERFQLSRSTPTLKGFGGAGREGVCVVTGSGLVGAVSGRSAPSASVPLRPARDRVTAAALAHKNGKIVAAALCVCGGRASVRAGAVTVTLPLALQLTPLPTLYLPEDTPQLPVCLSWKLSEEVDSLFVGSTTVTLWKLTERAYPVHKLLAKGSGQGSTTPGGGPKSASECFATLSWQATGAWPVEGGEVAAGVASGGPRAASLAALVTPRSLHLIGDSPHYLCSRAVVTSSEVSPPSSTPPKKTKYGSGLLPSGARCARACGVSVSRSGCAVVVVDTHSQLHLYKHTPAHEHASQAVSQTCALLEYATVSGHDCVDALIGLKPDVLEALYERLTENFQRQPTAFQQHYYYAWIRLRMLLCSMIPSGQASASNLTSVLMSGASSAALAGALRPPAPRPDDKDSPSHALAVLAGLFDDQPDHDKNLLALEAKAEALGETALSALQPLLALRRPLRRALHTALTALAALQNSTSHHGYEVWADPAALGVLRKLLVVSRCSARSTWGGVEAGVGLQSALARLAASPHNVKPDLLEECLTLCVHNSSRVWDVSPRCGVGAPHSRPPPYRLEYGVEPESLRYVPEPPPHAVSELTPSFEMDAIRYRVRLSSLDLGLPRLQATAYSQVHVLGRRRQRRRQMARVRALRRASPVRLSLRQTSAAAGLRRTLRRLLQMRRKVESRVQFLELN
ncbi:mediator of RNA polymerase II transcription subunit 16 isoform X1 [Pieris napi]|uniref:mediator of RNA polymerase II transcription subunit 16 isoform X1 n=1 Tax=Pieris napi TaxID=78633 RepID=UPI001FB8B9C9|nr:mediator of RNA polymerase II transcription subunit 16 isoform X1 [Pieris napi]